MANVLVVEDDLFITGLLRSTLDGYNIITVLNGRDAVQCALRETPQLILLNSVLTEADNYNIIWQLQNHPKSMHIPIIMLSEQSEITYKVHAFEAGVDDYITKPFHNDELLVRVRVQLRRVQQRFLSPLTGLPGGLQVEQAIRYNLGQPDPWSILYLDLDNFKAFNDVYGFLVGNDLIRLVGRICQHMVREYGNSDDFVGHIGGDDFVIMTTPNRTNTLVSRIAARFEEESTALYRHEDRERGSISGVDRKGRPYQFPFVSLSIGEVSNQTQQPRSMQEMSYLTAEAKYHAKQSTGDIYYTPAERDRVYTDHAQSALLSPSSSLTRSPSVMGHLHHDLLHVLEGETMIEFEQRVY